MDFVAVLDQVIALLRQRGRLTYSTLKRQFQLDEAALDDVKNELIEGQRLAVDERGNVLVWTGDTAAVADSAAASALVQASAPLAYTPPYLAEKILTTRSAMEGERKQVTVLFAGFCRKVRFLGQNPKIGYQKFNDLQTAKISKKQLCDRTPATV
jgi:hypothetical protein